MMKRIEVFKESSFGEKALKRPTAAACAVVRWEIKMYREGPTASVDVYREKSAAWWDAWAPEKSLSTAPRYR